VLAQVEVVSSVDAALEAAAIAAVQEGEWFKPSMRCGKAMAGGTFMVRGASSAEMKIGAPGSC